MPDAEPEPTVEGRVRKFDRPAPPHDWRWWVSGLGKTLIAVGLLMFGFVAYQLWGTGIETARAQDALESEFEELLAGTSPTTTTSAPAIPPGSVPVDSVPVTPDPPVQQLPPVEEGDPIARIEIPSIGVDYLVVAGVSTADLKKGPGHYPETPLPGQLGNAAIAGHRTTYGQPFFDIDKVNPGDEVVVTTLAGRFVYRVAGQQIVSPSDYEVVATADATQATLTLTSCHPKWTARERIVVTADFDAAASSAPAGAAVLDYGRSADDVTETSAEPTSTDGEPVDSLSDPATVVEDPTVSTETETETGTGTGTDVQTDAQTEEGMADAFAEGWFSDPAANAHVGLWGLLLAAIGIGSYLISKRAKRDWVGLLVGIVPFLVTLYFFFQNVNRLLPPNL